MKSTVYDDYAKSSRAVVRAWEKDNEIERPRAFAESTPSSARRRDIFELIRDDAEPEAIQEAIDAYFTFEAEQGTELTTQFLSGLPEEDRRFVVETQQRYKRTVNQWVPSRT